MDMYETTIAAIQTNSDEGLRFSLQSKGSGQPDLQVDFGRGFEAGSGLTAPFSRV